VSKTFGEWYQKTNKAEDTNKLNLLAFKTIAILHNTLLATFIKFLETVSKGPSTYGDLIPTSYCDVRRFPAGYLNLELNFAGVYAN
jgi:hypothetical protein